MPNHNRRSMVYLANATALLLHQIDAAYWHEWTMFHLPGGIQLFLALNVPIVALVLYGVHALGRGAAAGITYSWLLVGAGAFAVVFHGIHLVRGDAAFTLPVSLALLAAICVLTLAQAVLLIQARQPGRPSTGA